MQELYICDHCGEEFPLEETLLVEGDRLCRHCAAGLTALCDECGARIYLEHDEGDSNRFLCSSCRECIRRSKRAAKPRMMVHRHRVNGAAVPDVWCTAAVGMVHTAAARFHYSGIPLRLRMDSPSIWMV